ALRRRRVRARGLDGRRRGPRRRRRPEAERLGVGQRRVQRLAERAEGSTLARALARARGGARLAEEPMNTLRHYSVALAVLLCGCNVEGYCLDCFDAGPKDAGTDARVDAYWPDAWRVWDSGTPVETDGCAPSAVELCNDAD